MKRIYKIGFEKNPAILKFLKSLFAKLDGGFSKEEMGKNTKRIQNNNHGMVDPKRTVLHPVHNTLEKLGNAVLFLRSGIPSALIRHESGSF